MTGRAMHLRARAPVLVLLAGLLAGCASLRNTPQQDYVWAMWDQCKATGELGTSTLVIDRVEADGRYWTNTTVGPAEVEWPVLQRCMNKQFRAHPYPDWLRARQGSVKPSPR